MSDSFPKSIELKKRSLYERIIVAKVLLESVLDELPSVQPTHPTPSNTLGALDCVDRAEVIKTVKFYETFCDPYPRVIEELEGLPSVQPERKEGKWIKDRDGIYHCSCCGTDYLMYELAVKDTHYCPNCGCRMEEGDSDD